MEPKANKVIPFPLLKSFPTHGKVGHVMENFWYSLGVIAVAGLIVLLKDWILK